MIRLIVLLALFPGLLFAQDTWKDVYSESAWKERDIWQKPNELIRYLNLKPGSQVADVGCHEGYMTLKLSGAVGNQGKVFAVDIEQPKLDRLNKHLEDRQITNVTTIKGTDDDPLLPAGALDAVVILDTYHEMDAHESMLRHIKDALKPGGRLVLCEAIAEARRNGTREEQERKHELAMRFALEDVRKAGFSLVYQADPFVDRTAEKGDKMWILVVKK